ncbi:hypothetical protein AB205_0019280 [Aquarana catesbeiana]|uniref:WGR domain-containing protein n=1 Tax=Aquarana catesbeiana TaxID=8400 RepID=A0A2G9RAH1_AQUCT|nr:hypothetical protein AB205_0019280 [Aquarana catesbeiana]
MENVRSERVVGNSDRVWAPSDIFHRIFRHTKTVPGAVGVSLSLQSEVFTANRPLHSRESRRSLCKSPQVVPKVVQEPFSKSERLASLLLERFHCTERSKRQSTKMAPKRRAATQAQNTRKGKKTKVKEEIKEEEIQAPAPDRFQSAVQALKAASGKKGKAKVDSACTLTKCAGYEVFEDYDCMLNQTNIGHNNNKFYIIQLLHWSAGKPPQYVTWNRWGRVGEVGQNKTSYFTDAASAKKDFEKKFKDKTKNNWSDRENFTAHAGKYTMIEVEHDDEEEDNGEAVVKVDTVDGVSKKKVKTCSLDKPTQDLMTLIFSSDMFKEAMQTMNLGKQRSLSI